ncbi:MAG TPA: amidase family protein, partial [Symbiobacteriaceae bacterium]|nr:amidase family protein [Symbiobacteriaceae bacterium]
MDLFAPAHQLAAGIRLKEFSALELLTALLDQIDRVNPRLNAIVTLDREGALAHAKAADEALARGELWGALHGLPVTLKDAFTTAGMRTTCGHPPLADFIPETDSAPARRLKAVGAILIGKTNVPELCDDWQSDNPVFGRTLNPWDPSRTPGGSSGGAAAAVAAGLSTLDIGSDIGGSIRVPATYCGLYGFKPTEGRVSGLGHIPPLPGTPRTVRLMNCVGPIARSASDLIVGYKLLAGPEPGDTEIPPVPFGEIERVHFGGLRVAWAPSFPGTPAAAPIRRGIAKLADELLRQGALVEAALPNLSTGQNPRQTWLDPVKAQAQQAEWAAYERAFAHLIGYVWQNNPGTAEEYLHAVAARDRFITAWERFFGDFDLLLCPVTSTTAFEHGGGTPRQLLVDGEPLRYKYAHNFCRLFNLTGNPSVVIPLGQDEQGLPFGVQLVGPRWGD